MVTPTPTPDTDNKFIAPKSTKSPKTEHGTSSLFFGSQPKASKKNGNPSQTTKGTTTTATTTTTTKLKTTNATTIHDHENVKDDDDSSTTTSSSSSKNHERITKRNNSNSGSTVLEPRRNESMILLPTTTTTTTTRKRRKQLPQQLKKFFIPLIVVISFFFNHNLFLMTITILSGNDDNQENNIDNPLYHVNSEINNHNNNNNKVTAQNNNGFNSSSQYQLQTQQQQQQQLKNDLSHVQLQSQRQMQQHSQSNSNEYDPCKEFPKQGPEREMGFRGLSKIDSSPKDNAQAKDDNRDDGGDPPIKILCILYNATSADFIEAAYDIYGRRCDKFLPVTINISNTINSDIQRRDSSSFLALKQDKVIEILPILSPTLGEWENLLKLLQYIQKQHEDIQQSSMLPTTTSTSYFDFVHIATERTLVIEENLRHLLSSVWQKTQLKVKKKKKANNKRKGSKHNDTSQKNELVPLYIGGPALFQNDPTRRYCSPGAGYSLTLAAINIILKSPYCNKSNDNYNDNDNDNKNNDKRMNMTTHEKLADCLYNHNTTFSYSGTAPVICENTMDGKSLRYLEYGVEFTEQWTSASPGPIQHKELKLHHQMTIADSHDGVSKTVVGIHIMDGILPINFTTTSIASSSSSSSPSSTTTSTTSIPNIMRRYRAIIDNSCEEVWSDRTHYALDEYGNPGYVHDATYLRNNPIPLNLHQPNHHDDNLAPCEPELGTSMEGSAGYKGLQKIHVYKTTTAATTKTNSSTLTMAMANNGNMTNIRLMCIVYTHSGNHESRIRAIAETYAQHCDGFMAASNETNKAIGAVNLLHEGPETYENMWLKVKGIWMYVYKHYLNDFDFFHIGGDDMYVIPENLKYLVSTGSLDGPWNQEGPLYLGAPIPDYVNGRLRFCGGGAGYTLNQKALKLMGENILNCGPHYETSQEDRFIAHCFRLFGVTCPNSQDEFGEERYHHSNADFHADWSKGKPAYWTPPILEKFHGIKSPEHLGQISKYSVSFHLKDAKPKHFADFGMR